MSEVLYLIQHPGEVGLVKTEVASVIEQHGDEFWKWVSLVELVIILGLLYTLITNKMESSHTTSSRLFLPYFVPCWLFLCSVGFAIFPTLRFIQAKNCLESSSCREFCRDFWPWSFGILFFRVMH